MFLIYILIFIIIIELVTLIHESGHFLVAKKNGVRVAEFAIGFGPAIFQINRGNTTYSLRWLPFGGYVSVLSQDVINEIEKIRSQNISPMQREMIEKKLAGIKLDEDFSKQKPIDKISSPRKVLFAVAGVMFNFISIFILLIFNYWLFGQPSNTGQIYIPNTNSNSAYLINSISYFDTSTNSIEVISGYDNMANYFEDPAGSDYPILYQDVGKGDLSIVKLNFTYLDFSTNTLSSNNDTAFFATSSKGLRTGSTKITNSKGILAFFYPDSGPTFYEFNNGLGMYIEYQDLIPLSGFSLFWNAFVDSFKYFWLSILWLINFVSLGFVHVGYHPTTSIYSQNFFFQSLIIFFLNITVLLSALMIVFNLLPIPPLDGWRVVEYTYEGKNKKTITKETEKLALKIGWGLLVLLFVLGIFI